MTEWMPPSSTVNGARAGERRRDPLDHHRGRQVADVVEELMGDPVVVGGLGLGVALEQLDLALEAGDDRRRAQARPAAERGAMLVGRRDDHRIGLGRACCN